MRIKTHLGLILLMLVVQQAPANDSNSLASFPLARLSQAYPWMCQLQELDASGALDTLSRSEALLLVLEPIQSIQGRESFDLTKMLRQLRATPTGQSRILLAYIHISEAQPYRAYWQPDWKSPQKTSPGSPDFLLPREDAGWGSSFEVAYWDPRWKSIWFGARGWIQHLAKAGFDGVVIDGVEAYLNPSVVLQSKLSNINPALEMIKLIEEIRSEFLKVIPECVVMTKNGIYLCDKSPDRYFAAVDGLIAENTWFDGYPDMPWGSPLGGDHANHDTDNLSTTERLKQYKRFREFGKPVFTLDYCLKTENAKKTMKASIKEGLRPLVTRKALSKISPFLEEPDIIISR